MKRYEEYKAVEYDWLNEVPKHWERSTIRSITSLSDKRNKNRSDLELLSVYRDYGVIKKSSRSDNHNVESLDLSNYKYVDVNYIVLNKMKMWQGSLGVSKYEGIVSPAYIVCKLDYKINSLYLNYLLRSATFKTFYNRVSYGVRVGQWDMRYDDFKSLSLYLPTKEEQEKIVSYLDWKLAKINKLVKAKQKQIALLKEQKQAIINQAVTKGLDPNVEMKDSGVEWLGEVPKDWDRLFLFQVAEEQKNSNKYIHNQNLLSLSYGNIVNKNINMTDGLLPLSFDNYQVVDDGNIILRLTDLQNDHRSLRVGLVTQTGIITSAYTCLKPRNNILPMFIYLLLHSFDICKGFYGMGGGVRQSIGYRDINKLIIFLPSILQQNKIIYYCEKISVEIDIKISQMEKEIDLITEYRTTLISDVVTGKVDIRDVVVPTWEDDEILEDEVLEDIGELEGNFENMEG